MSFTQGSAFAAAAAATIALSAVAYADTGKSPNGAPGPAGNPNQPAGTPQANAPQGPAGNDASGRSQSAPARSHAKSHGKFGASHGKSGEGKLNNFGKGKIAICHATRSERNPYVEITISVNGLHGHGPADDSRHHARSWKDIIPAPEGGCPTTRQQQATAAKRKSATTTSTTTSTTTTTTTTTTPRQGVTAFVALRREVAAQAPASESPQRLVLGANASGGGNPPAPAAEVRAADTSGTLPFTGTQVAFVLIVGAVALLGGIALRRALSHQS